jgi:predicted DCC family thiol-disulfide oxidoreductase YuxK
MMGRVSDARLRAFYVLFGVGAVAHVCQIIARQHTQLGTFLFYAERWEPVLPVGFPGLPLVASGLNLLFLLCGVMLIVGRRPLLWGTLLFVVGVAKMWTFVEWIPNHYNLLLLGSFATALLFGIRLHASRAGTAHAAAVERLTDEWFCRAMRHVIAITYLFAFVHKLNYGWFDPSGHSAGNFLYVFARPVLRLIGGEGPTASVAIGQMAVYSTLLIEAALPILLWIRRLRPYGVMLGISFHVIMMAQSILDYPTLILGFYPLFFNEAEFRAFVRNAVAVVTPGKLWASLALGTYAAFVWRIPTLTRLQQPDWTGPKLLESMLGDLLIYGWTYVGIAMLWQVLFRPRAAPVVLYDGGCGFCLRTVAALRRADIGGRVAYQDLRSSPLLQQLDIKPEAALSRMHVVVDGRTFAGFAAFRAVLGHLGIVSLLAPLLYLPGVGVVGERVYGWVADRRHRWLRSACEGGVCALGDHLGPRRAD